MIMLNFEYMMIYFLMENLFLMSRIQSTSQMQNRYSSKQVAKIIKSLGYIFVGIFVLVEFLLMVLVIITVVPKKAFEIQLSVITGVLVLSLNISMIFLYCRYAGTPYKSDQHYKNLRHCGLVALYWTLSFSLKLITSFIDSINPVLQPLDDDNKDPDHESSTDKLLYATIYFSLSIVCDIVPLMLIVDS